MCYIFLKSKLYDNQSHNALWADECHFAKIGLIRVMVAVGLNLLPFCRCYKNVIHSLVAINTKEIIELESLSKTDN